MKTDTKQSAEISVGAFNHEIAFYSRNAFCLVCDYLGFELQSNFSVVQLMDGSRCILSNVEPKTIETILFRTGHTRKDYFIRK